MYDIDKLSSITNDDMILMTLDDKLHVRCISASGPIHTDLRVARGGDVHQQHLDCMFPHMMSLVLSAVATEAIKTATRHQTAMLVDRQGIFAVTCWPLVEQSEVVGCTVQIQRRMMTVSELARLIK